MQLKAGVIGLGIVGSGYVRFFKEQPEVKVTAVADIRGERAQEIGNQVGAQSYVDYGQMLKEQKLDLVVVATPDPLHKQPVLAAIKAGVSKIVLEKPMATTLTDAEEMMEAAARTGSCIFMNFANRGSSSLDGATYYVIQNKLLGEIVYGEVRLDDKISVPIGMWGGRSREWAAGSSSAHFLLSHVVDYVRWIMAPAEVTRVFAISQQKVLGYTPDLYDAFLIFNNGAKFRVKGGWIKFVDSIVEFALSFCGTEGTLTHIKRPGFGEVEGWRANVSDRITPDELLDHQNKLLDQGINVRALFHRPTTKSMWMDEGEGEFKRGLEAFTAPSNWWRLARSMIDAVLEDTPTPSSWTEYGPLPTGTDGLRQTQIVCAIVESAERGQPMDCRL